MFKGIKNVVLLSLFYLIAYVLAFLIVKKFLNYELDNVSYFIGTTAGMLGLSYSNEIKE